MAFIVMSRTRGHIPGAILRWIATWPGPGIVSQSGADPHTIK